MFFLLVSELKGYTVWVICMEQVLELNFIGRNYIAMPDYDLGDLSEIKFKDGNDLKIKLDKKLNAYSTKNRLRLDSRNIASRVAPLKSFLLEAKIDDYVVYRSESNKEFLYVGTISSDYKYDSSVINSHFPHIREVNWKSYKITKALDIENIKHFFIANKFFKLNKEIIEKLIEANLLESKKAISESALTAEQREIQQLQARIHQLEQEKMILKRATALLISDESKHMR